MVEVELRGEMTSSNSYNSTHCVSNQLERMGQRLEASHWGAVDIPMLFGRHGRILPVYIHSFYADKIHDLRTLSRIIP